MKTTKLDTNEKFQEIDEVIEQINNEDDFSKSILKIVEDFNLNDEIAQKEIRKPEPKVASELNA